MDYFRFGVAAGCAMSVVVTSGVASALNWAHHDALVRATTTVLYDVGHGQTYGPYEPPEGVPADTWQQYLGEISTSYDNLRKLQTGLDKEPPISTLTNVSRCGYDQRYKISGIEGMPISELPFAVSRHYNESCAMVPLSCDNRYRALGSTLGWHAGQVDEQIRDTVLWFRPTSAAGLAIAKEATAEAWEYLVGVLLLPIVCFWDCSAGFDFADEYNPVDAAVDWIPGIGDITDSSYVGLWHFLDQNYGSFEADYNDPPGMLYEWGGPDTKLVGPSSEPGAIDLAIMLAGDVAGLSLNGGESKGVSRYGAYDEHTRSDNEWQAQTIGRTEFSPVDNLAQWGWNKYLDDPTTAKYLGWPLHALGDIAMPHHLVATTSWGHRPFEDAQSETGNGAIGYAVTDPSDPLAGDHFPLTPTGGTSPVPAEVVRRGFFFWNVMRDLGRFELEGMIQGIAAVNYGQYDYGNIFLDSLSVMYLALEEQAIATYKTCFYGSGGSCLGSITQSPYQNSMAGILTLLIEAGRVAEPGPDRSGEYLCPPTQRATVLNRCDPAPPSHVVICEPCSNDGDCPSGECTDAGYCLNQKGEGEACTHDSECQSNYCSPDGTCQQRPIDQGLCQSDSDCPSQYCLRGVCQGSVSDVPQQNGGGCGVPQDCLSGYCNAQRVCADVPPAGTVEGNGICLSNSHCVNGQCLMHVCIDWVG